MGVNGHHVKKILLASLGGLGHKWERPEQDTPDPGLAITSLASAVIAVERRGEHPLDKEGYGVLCDKTQAFLSQLLPAGRVGVSLRAAQIPPMQQAAVG
jgi:hypothetical protein